MKQNINESVFRRIFSITMYKNRKICLGEMSFSKDFVTTDRGDLYPVVERMEQCIERVRQNCYAVQGGVERIIGAFFPYATYEMKLQDLSGECGFVFSLAGAKVYVFISGTKDTTDICIRCGQAERRHICSIPDITSLIVSCRPGAFDIYRAIGEGSEYITSFECPEFACSDLYELFSKATAGIYVNGAAKITRVKSYLDCGISQADIRPIRYENGEIMIENGKIYLTMSVRLEERMYQGVFSWIPGTAELEMTGALFYDSGNGRWGYDVAASVLYHRRDRCWYLWVCSFSNGHILGHTVCEGDIRFGINVVDIELMPKTDADADISVFAGMEGDEDPDFFFDEEKGKWYMAICRVDKAINNYRYVFFESDKPFEGYRYIGKGYDGAETGGSFVKIDKEQYFICGNSFKEKSDYRIYSKEGMTKAVFDYPDGGFRGWGTLMPVKLGSRTRYFWMTFDRHNGSAYNWSYGNVYCFELSSYGLNSKNAEQRV